MWSQTSGMHLIKSPDNKFAYQDILYKPIFIHKLSENPIHNQNSYVFKSPYNHRNELGFICKWELDNDKSLKRPIRFRLGSYDYVNRMEGK